MSKASKARKAKWNRGFTKVPLAQRKEYVRRWRICCAKYIATGYSEWLSRSLINRVSLERVEAAHGIRVKMKKYVEDLEVATAATRANRSGPRFNDDVHTRFARETWEAVGGLKVYGTPILQEFTEAVEKLDKLKEQQ